MRRLLAAALIPLAVLFIADIAAAQTPPPTQTSPAKKELVQRLMRLQQADVEGFARTVVERPAAQMMREAGLALQQQQAPQDKREAAARAIEAEVKKYVDEAYPIVRDRAVKMAPSTIGVVLETKMTEDELRQLIAWLESPTAKKYQSLATDLRNSFSQKLVAEMPAVLDPKLMALDGRIRVILGVPPAGAPPAGSTASPPARPASK
ncbi:MAG TPA: hypothetical protein VLD35_01460 [Caldimonas sp.]|nr:hypothetical protein [Caldimonas sp.]